MRFKSALFLFYGIDAVMGPSQATPKKLEVVRLPTVPVAIRASIPHGGKTWLYGKMPAELSKRPASLHFYSIPTPRLAPELAENEQFRFNPRDYILNLWEWSGSGRRIKFHRLNSVRFSGAEFLRGILIEKDAEFIKTKADVLWLRESTRQTPIVRLHVEIGNALNVFTASSDLLFVFNKGLKNAPYIQQFINFYEEKRASSHNYDRTDEQGILIITRQDSTFSNIEEPVRTQTELRWNGHAFVPQSEATPSS